MNDENTTDGLDLSAEYYSGDRDVKYEVGDEYDPRPHEDAARRNIAYLLIGLLWVIVLGIFILLMFDCIALIDIKEFAVLLGPIVALVSAATGFYYGTKNST